jgi:Protein of unknown function (DUF1559)
LRVAAYLCPSDTGTIDQSSGTYQRTRGNYMVNWGNALYDDTRALPTGTVSPSTTGPFYHLNGRRATPGVVGMQNITDGTSNTLLLSESLIAKVATDNDWRARSRARSAGPCRFTGWRRHHRRVVASQVQPQLRIDFRGEGRPEPQGLESRSRALTTWRDIRSGIPSFRAFGNSAIRRRGSSWPSP